MRNTPRGGVVTFLLELKKKSKTHLKQNKFVWNRRKKISNFLTFYLRQLNIRYFVYQ